MIEEPYRWLEAIANRREYVRDQIKQGSPCFGVSLTEGVLLVGVGSGDSKVFEIFDRHAMAGLGHPADLEKIRMGLIDTAHTEGFARASEDVSLRRLVSFGVSPQLKSNFEQIFSAPFLVELLLAEVGHAVGHDTLVRLHYDGAYQIESSGIVVIAPTEEKENAARTWLNERIPAETPLKEAVDLSLQAWWGLLENKPFDASMPEESVRREGWRSLGEGRTIELGWLARESARRNRYASLTLAEIGL